MLRLDRVLLLSVSITIILLAAGGCVPDDEKKLGNGQDDKEVGGNIRILWADWEPAQQLEILVEDFSYETGIEVEIVKVPWPKFQETFFSAMEAGLDSYDIVIGDSQWLGKGATEEWYVDLTKWIEREGFIGSMTESSIRGYSEYPKGSGKYWAIPFQGDSMGFAYRKDIFADEAEKIRFFEDYGYELGAPKNLDELMDVTEFFYRPDEGFYGIIVWTEKEYDGITMSFEKFLWTHGGMLGDRETFDIYGRLNSEKGAKALSYMKKLYDLSPKVYGDVFYLESNEAFLAGDVAIAENFFGFFPDLLKGADEEMKDNIGFFPMPEGQGGKATALGGQGASLLRTSKNKEDALLFLSWFAEKDTQEKWAQIGGFTSNREVLSSDKFLSLNPYNKAYKESIEVAKDFWAVPEYAELLAVMQNYLYQCVVEGRITEQAALDMIAKEWEEIFERGGYYKE